MGIEGQGKEGTNIRLGGVCLRSEDSGSWYRNYLLVLRWSSVLMIREFVEEEIPGDIEGYSRKANKGIMGNEGLLDQCTRL